MQSKTNGTKVKARKKTVAERFAENIAEELVDESADAPTVAVAAEQAAPQEEADAEPPPEHLAAAAESAAEEEGGFMRGFSFFLALLSLAIALGAGYMVYGMNGKITRLEAQNASQISLARDMAALRSAVDKMEGLDESVRSLRTSLAKISADNLQTLANIKDNAVEIDEMKRRFNRLIDAVK